MLPAADGTSDPGRAASVGASSVRMSSHEGVQVAAIEHRRRPGDPAVITVGYDGSGRALEWAAQEAAFRDAAVHVVACLGAPPQHDRVHDTAAGIERMRLRASALLSVELAHRRSLHPTTTFVASVVDGPAPCCWRARRRRELIDPDIPAIGAEVAVARALTDLAGQLSAPATTEIQRWTSDGDVIVLPPPPEVMP